MVALSILIPLAIVFIPMLIVGLIKSRRARRRRAGAPHDSVAGAWEELIDRFSELGYDVPPASTRIRVAEHLENQVEGERLVPLRSLAVVTDEAVFSGEEVTAERATTAWTEAQTTVEAGRRGLSRLRLFFARYRIRSARDGAHRISTKK